MMRKRTVLLITCVLTLLLCMSRALAISFYSHGDRQKPRIAITVDDCFDKSIMRGFLDTARQHRAKLSFFVIGRTMQGDDDEALFYRILDEGHEIGNHSNNHKNMESWSHQKIEQELAAFQKRLDRVLGFRYQPNLLRFPFGIGCTAPGLENYNRAAEQLGYQNIIHWDVVLEEPEQMLQHIQNGSIVLLHANKKDLKVFRQIVGTLAARYELVTVSELLHLPPVEYDRYG